MTDIACDCGAFCAHDTPAPRASDEEAPTRRLSVSRLGSGSAAGEMARLASAPPAAPTQPEDPMVRRARVMVSTSQHANAIRTYSEHEWCRMVESLLHRVASPQAGASAAAPTQPENASVRHARVMVSTRHHTNAIRSCSEREWCRMVESLLSLVASPQMGGTDTVMEGPTDG